MPSIDERVVAMSFENQVFESRVATTMATLSKLDTAVKNIGGATGFDKIEASATKVTLERPMSALEKLKAKFGGAGAEAAQGLGEIDRAGNKVTLEGPARAVDKLQGKMGQLSAGTTFTDIEKAADRVELSGLTRALDNVTNKFSVLEGAASVALGGIASNAAMKGGAFAKSFAFGPIQQGLGEYQTNLNSIQTILANTQGQQVSGLGEVQKHLGELNTYSDKTIYNFSEMAKNIGTFTAAGVGLDESTKSIKGIANLAALSGSNSQQASTAMYQLSQAISSGKVGLQDWNSVVNAGMGGAVFQKSLMRTAENMGAIEKGALKIDKATGKATINGETFRNSIMAKPGEESWLTSDVLVNTLGQLTGDMTDAELAAQGFTQEQIKAIQAQAKTAQDAATQVKTLPQVFDVARETIGSGWSKTFELIFGNFEESKKTFTAMSNFINGFINKSSDARNKILTDWKELGGRQEMLQGFKDIAVGVQAIFKPIADAFHSVFGKLTGDDLEAFTARFHNFTTAFAMLGDNTSLLDNLQRTFAGLFAVLHIGWTIIKAVTGVIFDLLGAVGKGSGGFLSFTGGIGDFLVSVDAALTKGGALTDFFKGLETIIQAPLSLLGKLASAIVNLFQPSGGGQTGGGFAKELDEFGRALTPVERLINRVKDAWNTLSHAFADAKTALEPWFSSFVDKLRGLGDILADAFGTMDFDKIMGALQTGFIGGIFLVLKKALGDGLPSIFGDAFEGVNSVMKGLTGNLEAMQKNIQANTLLKIGAAVVVLAGGIYILSTIDGDDLSKAMTAVAVGLGELTAAMKLLTTGTGKLGFLQLAPIAGALIGLAIAVTILAGAVKIFSTMKWEDIGKGLAGVAGSLGAIALAMKFMPATLPLSAAGLVLIGVALNAIALALKQFGSMKLEEIAKGVFAVVEALAGIALGVSMMPPTLPLTAAGLILMGIALNAIGVAIGTMGSMDFLTIVKGLGTMMVAIAGIGLAVSLIPPTIALTAVGLLLVGQAMVVVAAAIAILGNLSVGTLIKGIVGLAGALIVLAAGLTLMIVSLPGALALLVAAGALAVLAPVLGVLGTMKWSTIFKGLAAMALVMVTIGVAGLIAAPALLLLGVALIPLGLGFILVAKGAKIFASALALLGDQGKKSVAVFIAALTGFIALLPNIIVGLIKDLLGVVDQIAVLAPKVVVALGVIIDTIIAFVIESAPKLAMAIGILVDSIIEVLLTNSPKIIAAGFKLLTNLLAGLSQNIGRVTNKASEVIVKFLSALTANAGKLVDAGAKTLVAFVQGITNNIPKVVTAVTNMVTKFIAALAGALSKIVGAGQDLILKLIGAIAGFTPKMVAKGTEIIISFLDGIEKAIPRIKNKALSLARTFLNSLAEGLAGMADIAFKALIKFLNGLADAIRNNQRQLYDAGANIAHAIVDGLIGGFGRLGGTLRSAIERVFQQLPGWAKKVLGIHSPSSVFMELGKFSMLGFSKGIQDNSGEIVKSSKTVAASVVNTFRSSLGIHSPSEVMRDIGQQVNRGFAQGLRGSQDDVRGAFQELNEKLTTAMRDARQAIRDNQRQLDEERAKNKPDWAAIQAAEAAIAANEAVLQRTTAAHIKLTKALGDEKDQLLRLKDRYDVVTQKLDAARQTLDDAKKARDDAKKSLTEKFDTTPTVDDESKTKVADYVKALTSQIAATKSYTATLAQLRALGLDDKTYQKLLDEGLAGKDFAEQLLAGGQSAVTSVNTLDTQLLAAAKTLSNDMSKELYNAGVNAAQGLVNSLKERKGFIEEAMAGLGKAMVQAIKRELKIKSPSRVMTEVGKYTAQGVIDGLRGSSQAVTDAAASIGDDAASAMSDGLSHISEILSAEVDPDLTVTPVLDLTQFQKDAQQLSGHLTNVVPITAAASYGQATSISAEKSSVDAAVAGDVAAGIAKIEFNQTNTSPESLSEVEIYRQTNNQLAKLKSLVGVP